MLALPRSSNTPVVVGPRVYNAHQAVGTRLRLDLQDLTCTPRSRQLTATCCGNSMPCWQAAGAASWAAPSDCLCASLRVRLEVQTLSTHPFDPKSPSASTSSAVWHSIPMPMPEKHSTSCRTIPCMLCADLCWPCRRKEASADRRVPPKSEAPQMGAASPAAVR